jgi:hypothetical protein
MYSKISKQIEDKIIKFEVGKVYDNNKKEIDVSKLNFKKCTKKPVTVSGVVLDFPIVVVTLEGPLNGNKGDILIKGIKDEFYAIKPDIFEQTYKWDS